MHGSGAKSVINRPLTGPKDCFYMNGEWNFPHEACKELKKRPFFKRFRLEDLLEFIPDMKVAKFKANEIIYVEDRACVILSGSV
jgi:hypothetical protein